jgi:hypothetical protein
MEKTMKEREFEPGESGQDDPVPPQRPGSPQNKERRPAGTQAALDENVENPLDDDNGTRSCQREQPYPVRWLRAHYAVSGSLAAIIAAEFGWGGL